MRAMNETRDALDRFVTELVQEEPWRDMSKAYDPAREELFHVAGDADHGVASTADLTKTAIGHPEVRYYGRHGDFVLTVDVYRMPDGQLLAHLICPRCRKALHIRQAAKSMEYSATDGLSIEPFECTWELDGDEGRQFGMALCRWRVGITRNVARDA
jgi:hypothetical protein